MEQPFVVAPTIQSMDELVQSLETAEEVRGVVTRGKDFDPAVGDQPEDCCDGAQTTTQSAVTIEESTAAATAALTCIFRQTDLIGHNGLLNAQERLQAALMEYP